jgi:hypothetical protein
MLFSPRGVSAGCIYALTYILGGLFTYRLASLFLMLLSHPTVTLRESDGPGLHARRLFGQPDEACPAAARQLYRAPGRDTQTQFGTYSTYPLFKMHLVQCISSVDMIRGGRTSVRQNASVSGAAPC